MAYYTKKTNRMNLHIEEDRKTILIQQKWKYNWLVATGASTWTYKEKKDYHNKIDNLIWNSWGQYFFLTAQGTSAFAKKHVNTRWDVNFDIQWVLNSEHWTVNVTKYPLSHGHETSHVRWNSRIIKLDTLDVTKRKRVRSGKNYYQYPAAHEFGHAAGNSIVARAGMHGDEYKSTSTHYNDKKSIMNLGMQLRDRHLDYILSQLNSMLPNTTFQIL